MFEIQQMKRPGGRCFGSLAHLAAASCRSLLQHAYQDPVGTSEGTRQRGILLASPVAFGMQKSGNEVLHIQLQAGVKKNTMPMSKSWG